MGDFTLHQGIIMVSQPLRVIFVLLIPLPYPSAAWTRIEFFANYLKNSNYDVRIVGAFSVKAIRNAGSFEMNNVKIYNVVPVIILTNIAALCINILSSLIVGFFLCLILRPRLIIISLPSSGLADTMGFFTVARVFKSRVIADYRDEWEDYIYHITRGKINRKFLAMIKKAMNQCYRKSDAVITVTNAIASVLSDSGIKDVKVIPNGADVEVFKPKEKLTCRTKFGIPGDCFVLIYSGYIGSYYRLDLLVMALKLVIRRHNAKAMLLIAGHGSGLSSLLRIANDEGIGKSLIYLGKIIDKSELSEALCASDVGIIPYDSKPLSRNALPVKSLEYLACGLPLIAAAHRDSILGRMMIENKLGLVVDPENIESTYNAIKTMEFNMEMRNVAKRRGPAFVREKYDRNKIASEFHSIAASCLNRT